MPGQLKPPFRGGPRSLLRPVRPHALPTLTAGTSVTIAGVDQTAYLRYRSMTLRLTSFDFGLIDPVVAPAVGDVVHVLEPAWTGTVVKVEQSDTAKKGTSKSFSLTASNSALAYATPAPFGISDAADNATTYPYEGLRLTKSRTDTGDERRGTCTVLRSGLWPGMTFTVTSDNFGLSAAQFSVTNVTVTWPTSTAPVYAIEFGDAMVELSVWVGATATSSVLPIDSTKITDGAVTTPKLAANSITADKFAANLVLASLIETGVAGARIEMDPNGIRAYDAGENLLVRIPTDDSGVYVNGQVLATSLRVTGKSEFVTDAHVLTGAGMVADAGISAPTQAPSLTQGYDSIALAAPNAPADMNFTQGGYYDPLGGADGATPCIVAIVNTGTASGTMYACEWKVSDGSLSRQTALGAGAVFGKGGFIVRWNAYWFVCHDDGLGHIQLTRFDRATGFYNQSITITNDWPVVPTGMGWPITLGPTAQYVYIAGTSAPASNVLINAYDALNFSFGSQGIISQSIDLTGEPGAGQSSRPAFTYAGTSWWLSNLVSGTYKMYEFDSGTGAVVANTQFETVVSSPKSIVWDGTQFKMISGGRLYSHTTWTWTTASPIYWVGYSWYDSAGTVHETTLGPRASITMKKRAKLTVTTATIPGVGGVDDPNNVRVYMAPNATDPGAGNFHLQATQAAGPFGLSTYTAAGAADGTGTVFPVSTPATISSFTSGWKLRGDGSTNFGAAVFPSGPVTNDQYFRTDLGLWFYYDGTRWLSNQLFVQELFSTVTSASGRGALSATTGIAYGGPVFVSTGSDTYIVGIVTQFLVASGGTALGASHSWIGTIAKRDTNAVDTTVATVTVNSGSSGVWRTDNQTLNALLGAASFVWTYGFTKTGTPGNFNFMTYIRYRIVAT